MRHFRPEYRYLFVDAAKSFWANESLASKKMLTALEATDPDRSDIRSVDWTLNIDVPQLQLLFYVNDSDDDFAEQLPKAVTLHKKFWSSNKERRDNWDGYVALELTGLAALAYDRNMPFEIESEFIFMDFVHGKPA